MHSLTLFTTGRCNLKCPYCTHAPRRRTLGTYDMPMQDVEQLIQRARELKLVFGELLLSGGEPLLWPHLAEALTRFRDSRIARTIVMVSNGMQVNRLTAVMPLLDRVRLSHYGRINGAQIRAARACCPEKVTVSHLKHRRPPDSPLEDTLPAQCNCPNQALIAGRFYVCANALANCLRLGLDPADPNLSCSMGDDFQAHFLEHSAGRFNLSICEICLANRPIWERMAHTEWKDEHPQWNLP